MKPVAMKALALEFPFGPFQTTHIGPLEICGSIELIPVTFTTMVKLQELFDISSNFKKNPQHQYFVSVRTRLYQTGSRQNTTPIHPGRLNYMHP